MADGGGKWLRGPAAVLALAAGLAVAEAQEAPDLRPGLLPEEAVVAADEAVVEEETVDEVPLAPQTTRLTVGPEFPVEVPPPLRRRREEDPYEPLGVRAGAFRLLPVVELDGVYSDNVNASPTKPLADVGLRVAPALRLESDWVRHSLEVAAAGEFIFYERNSNFNDTSLDADLALRFDVRRGTRLDLAASYALTQALSAAEEVPAAATSPRIDQQVMVAATLGQRESRILAALTAEAIWQFYGDVDVAGGGVESNAQRNYVQPGVKLRTGYEVSQALVPFVEVGYQPRFHGDQQVTSDCQCVNRDSHGGFLEAGVALDVPEMWSGEVGVRLDVRDYVASSLETAWTLGLVADLVWRPTRLTTVQFLATTGLDETETTGASAIRDWSGRIAVAHALRENLRLTGGVGAVYESYVGISLDEVTWSADVAIAYLLNRNVELVAGYSFTAFDTETPGGDYEENLVRVGARFRL
jgi:hypothetical protein